MCLGGGDVKVQDRIINASVRCMHTETMQMIQYQMYKKFMRAEFFKVNTEYKLKSGVRNVTILKIILLCDLYTFTAASNSFPALLPS